jgi:polysaccharide biosynthesis protein PelA
MASRTVFVAALLSMAAACGGSPEDLINAANAARSGAAAPAGSAGGSPSAPDAAPAGTSAGGAAAAAPTTAAPTPVAPGMAATAAAAGTAAGAAVAGPPDAPAKPAPPPQVEIDPATVPQHFRGDDSKTPSFGGWAWGSVPADAVAKAGFDWFETGYPGDSDTNRVLLAAGVRPFAYINLGEVTQDLKVPSGYTGPILRTNGDWGTSLVDVTDITWQDWLVRRADEAFRFGSRGIKWDVSTPDVPPGKTRSQVNDAIASVMARVLQQHPGLKFIFNQGAAFAQQYPQFVHAMETEGLFTASSYAPAHLKPWLDPYYWGPQYQEMKDIQRRGIPVIIAEYLDPASPEAQEAFDAIAADGFIPYITSDHWNVRGLGLHVKAGW